jgi:hypothetical protein
MLLETARVRIPEARGAHWPFSLPCVEQICEDGLHFEVPITMLVGENGDHGIRSVRWEDLDMVDHWRRYLDGPERYLRHLLDD